MFRMHREEGLGTRLWRGDIIGLRKYSLLKFVDVKGYHPVGSHSPLKILLWVEVIVGFILKRVWSAEVYALRCRWNF